MQKAIDFMESEGCEYSTLIADPKGHPRAKMYAPMGWVDYAPQNTWFNLASPISMIHHIPIAAPTFPALTVRSAFYELQRTRIENALKNHHITVKIYQPYRNPEYKPELIRRLLAFQIAIGKSQYDGFPDEKIGVWEYYRLHPVYRGLWLTYVALYREDQLIGMGSFARQWFYANRFGIHVPIGFGRDNIIDHTVGLSVDVYNLCQKALFLELRHAASQRDCMAIIYNTTPNSHHFIRALKTTGFIDTGANGTFMIRPMQPDIALPPKSSKPLYVCADENFGSM